ncbi:MAG: HYR domain-containing protein [Bacteroidia bacterium]
MTQTAGAFGSFFPVGTTTNTFVATDASGNTGSCSFTVTVNDAQAPNAICQNVTVQLNNTGAAPRRQRP